MANSPKEEREYDRRRKRAPELYIEIRSQVHWALRTFGKNSLIFLSVDAMRGRLTVADMGTWIEEDRARELRDRLVHYIPIIAAVVSDPNPEPPAPES